MLSLVKFRLNAKCLLENTGVCKRNFLDEIIVKLFVLYT